MRFVVIESALMKALSTIVGISLLNCNRFDVGVFHRICKIYFVDDESDFSILLEGVKKYTLWRLQLILTFI